MHSVQPGWLIVSGLIFSVRYGLYGPMKKINGFIFSYCARFSLSLQDERDYIGLLNTQCGKIWLLATTQKNAKIAILNPLNLPYSQGV